MLWELTVPWPWMSPGLLLVCAHSSTLPWLVCLGKPYFSLETQLTCLYFMKTTSFTPEHLPQSPWHHTARLSLCVSGSNDCELLKVTDWFHLWIPTHGIQ
jgi:hypothetical protein